MQILIEGVYWVEVEDRPKMTGVRFDPITALLASVGTASAEAGAVGMGAAGIATMPAAAIAATPTIGAGLGWGTLATGLGVLGTGLSVAGTMSQANTQADIAKYNAQVAQQQGQAAAETEKAKSRDMSEQRRKLVGAQVAGYAGAGVDPQVGTPLDVVANSYADYERDIQTTGYNADVAARTGQSQANIYDWGASRTLQAGYMKAGTQILGGVGTSLLKPGSV